MKFLLIVALCLQVSSLVFAKRRCECTECYGKMELGIVLDSSSSLSRDDFEKAREFVKEYVGAFEIGPDGVRVAVITYGRDVHVDDAFYLDTYDNEDDLMVAIDNIPHHHQSYTNTGGAIRFMRSDQLNAASCRAGVPRVAIVVTDGVSQKTQETAREAAAARDSGILVFSVGVGRNIDKKELFDIAGEDERVNMVGSYSKLVDITTDLARRTCEAASLELSKSTNVEL